MTRNPVICVGPVLDAITRLAMAVSLVVWVQFGIPSASDVLLATNPYPSMRYKRVVMFPFVSVLQLDQPIDDSAFVQFAMHDDQPYHRSCYKEFFHPKCDVCDNFVSAHNSIAWISMIA